MSYNSDSVSEFSKHEHFEPTNIIVTMEADHNYYVEIAPVVDGKPGPFRPLGIQEATKLGSILLNKSTRIEIGRVPSNLLFMAYNAGRYDLVWYTTPMIRKVHFKKELKIKSGDIPLPSLVWKYRNRTLYLF